MPTDPAVAQRLIGVDRWRPFRDRPLLLERHDELADEAARLDAEQQRLASELRALRRDLVAARDLLWPTEPGGLHQKARRPRQAGPPPVPPPAVDARPVSGRALRHAALAVLARAGSALSLPELHRALHLDGVRLTSGEPVKQLGDALAFEARRGGVRRVARGVYELVELSPARRRAASD